MIAPELWINREATEAIGNAYLVPRDGLPTWWATFYAINSVLWGDYTYLDTEEPLRIAFIQFWQVWFWGLWQIATAALVFIPYFFWAIIGIGAIYTIMAYEIWFFSFKEPRTPTEDDFNGDVDTYDGDWL